MNLTSIAASRRLDVVDAIYTAGKGHIGGALSCIDILVALYYSGFLNIDPSDPNKRDRDRFIISKGHSGIALYTVLSDLGFFPKSWLKSLNRGSHLGEHPDINIPGVETVSGALGHGLGIATGMAWAAKMQQSSRKSVVLLGDGECYEGSIWEAALFAAHHKLDKLLAIIDRNMLMSTGRTEQVNKLEPLSSKWAAFGWDVYTIDGHSMDEILRVLDHFSSREVKKPMLVISQTVKGKGLSSIEDTVGSHHGGIPESIYDEVRRN